MSFSAAAEQEVVAALAEERVVAALAEQHVAARLFLRDVANVTMDLNDVESIDFRALGGSDNIVVGDLSGTDVKNIGIDLRGPNGGGDARPTRSA